MYCNWDWYKQKVSNCMFAEFDHRKFWDRSMRFRCDIFLVNGENLYYHSSRPKLAWKGRWVVSPNGALGNSSTIGYIHWRWGELNATRRPKRSEVACRSIIEANRRNFSTISIHRSDLHHSLLPRSQKGDLSEKTFVTETAEDQCSLLNDQLHRSARGEGEPPPPPPDPLRTSPKLRGDHV
jgi:hypothetical protein